MLSSPLFFSFSYGCLQLVNYNNCQSVLSYNIQNYSEDKLPRNNLTFQGRKWDGVVLSGKFTLGGSFDWQFYPWGNFVWQNYPSWGSFVLGGVVLQTGKKKWGRFANFSEKVRAATISRNPWANRPIDSSHSVDISASVWSSEIPDSCWDTLHRLNSQNRR